MDQLITTTRYIVQYRNIFTFGEWKPVGFGWASTPNEAAAFMIPLTGKHPDTDYRIIESVKADGLVTQSVYDAA